MKGEAPKPKELPAPKQTPLLEAPKTAAKGGGKAVQTTTKVTTQTAKGAAKTAKTTAKTTEKAAKTTARTAKVTAKVAAKAAQKAAQAAKAAAQATVKFVKVAAKAIVAAVKATVAAVKGIVAAIAAGGWVAVVVILVIVIIGGIIAAVCGVFTPNDAGSYSVVYMMSACDSEYDARELEIVNNTPHDYLVIEGQEASKKEVIAVFAVLTNSTNKDFSELNSELLDEFRAVYNTMNTVDYYTSTSEETVIREYFAMGGISNYTQYRFWFVSDDGVSNWKLIGKTTPFVAGKYYKFVVEMQTKSGYTFPTYNSEPNFWAVVNGDYVKPKKTYGMDPTRYITISYEFGCCNDSVIENIIIDNVTEPIAGEKPTYTATVRGNGYYIDTAKNSYDDAYWLKPAEKWYYIKNGIGWFDMTDFDWVYENECFIPGHEYQVCVYLKTDDGFTFYHSKNYDMLFTASVNGTAAAGNTTTSWGLTEQTIRASFPCQGKKITTVMINGLSTPKAGEKPDYTASVAYPEWYRLDPNYAGTNGIVWYDSDDYPMEPTDTFVAGKKYKVEIKLISATLSGSNTSQFTSPVSAYINGKQVVENGIWDAVYASANTVYIYYTFPKEAEYTSVMVSGSVTSFNDVNGDITLQLIPEGYSEAAYETVVRGNIVEYKFSNVAAGTYTLKVMKENHVTREYTVVVGNSSVIQDVKIHLKGDINGDDKVNTSDVGKANAHVKKVSTLTGYEFAYADVNGDGKVNTSDVGKMNAHVKKTSMLW